MKFSFSRVVLPVLALAAMGLGFWHVSHESQSAEATPPPEIPPQTPYEDSVAASGVVEARTENIAIGAALSGLVLEVYVPSDQVGTQVAKDQPLFRVDDRHLHAQLKVAQSQLAAAEARLTRLVEQPRTEELPPALAKVKTAEANVARLKDQFERARKLVVTRAITDEEFVARQQDHEAAIHAQAQAQAEYDLLKAGAWQPDIQIAQAAVEEARSQIQQVETEIARATVRSPVDAASCSKSTFARASGSANAIRRP
jgi:multidrug efflux pump subunit AcrA (membrane-fusion protein)